MKNPAKAPADFADVAAQTSPWRNASEDSAVKETLFFFIDAFYQD
jgi:hypothetical protein